MKKILVFLALMLGCLAGIANAEFRGGFQLGVNYAGADYSNDSASFITAENKLGGLAGFLAEYQLSPRWAIQFQFNYQQKGIDFKNLPYDLWGTMGGPYFVADPDSKSELTLDYYTIPLYAKYYLTTGKSKPFLFAGPEFTILGTAEEKYDYSDLASTYPSITGALLDGQTFNQKSVTKDDMAVNFGIGLEYALTPRWNFFGSVGYSYGLIDIAKTDDIDYATNGILTAVGLTYCFTCGEPQAVVQMPQEIIRDVIKEFDLGKYDVPFFVSGYYRPNTAKNLAELPQLKASRLKDAGYIEDITPGTPKYEEYNTYAKTVDNLFNTIYINCVDEIFPYFINNSSPNEILEIAIYGYADPRRLEGRYLENDQLTFESMDGGYYTIYPGDILTNLQLSGLRAYHSGQLLQQLFERAAASNKTEYQSLMQNQRILFRYIGAEIANDGQSLVAQRRIKIVLTRLRRS